MSGICNVVYENTQVLSEDKNGKVEATVGMEINIMLDKSTSTKFVKDYEVAYDTYIYECEKGKKCWNLQTRSLIMNFR